MKLPVFIILTSSFKRIFFLILILCLSKATQSYIISLHYYQLHNSQFYFSKYSIYYNINEEIYILSTIYLKSTTSLLQLT